MDWNHIRRLAAPAALVLIGAAGASFWFSVGDGAGRRGASYSDVPPPGFDQLTEELTRVNREWMPRRRERVIERIERRADSLQAAVLWVLARPGHPLFAETARLAAIVGIESAHPLLRSAAMTAPAGVRVVAMQAADQLHEWPVQGFASMLASEEDPVVLVGVLGLCHGREPLPVGEIVDLLESDSAEVRQAALAALPDELPEAAVRTLMTWTEYGEADSDAALRALTAAAGSPKVRARLIDQIGSVSPATQVDILDAIGQHGDVGAGADCIWAMVGDTGRPIAVRIAAIRCLEQSGSADLERVRLELATLPPEVRLHAACILIGSGDRAGLTELVRLGDELVDARRLLAQMSGIRIHHGMTAFRRWLDDLGPDEIPALPSR